MVNAFPFALFIGTALGFLAGIGVGGGSLLIMWLTLVLEMPHPEARVLNLLFFLPTALIACLFRWKQGTLEIRKVLPAMIGGCVSAAVFSLISLQTDVTMLRKLFGCLLLIAGLKELFYRPRKAR